MGSHVWQFWYHNSEHSQKIDGKIFKVVVGIVCTEEEQDNRYTEEEFLGWCVLCSIVDLLPHVQIVVSTSIKFERYSTNPMEHEERAEHV